MKILLDTHIVIWALFDNPLLSSKAKELIMDSKNNDVFYSIISLLEIEVKRTAHPNKFKVSAKEVVKYCEDSDFTLLQLKPSAIDLLSTLERPENAAPHKDPFDKMLICQSLDENMTFITHDKLIGDYNLQNIIVV